MEINNNMYLFGWSVREKLLLLFFAKKNRHRFHRSGRMNILPFKYYQVIFIVWQENSWFLDNLHGIVKVCATESYIRIINITWIYQTYSSSYANIIAGPSKKSNNIPRILPFTRCSFATPWWLSSVSSFNWQHQLCTLQTRKRSVSLNSFSYSSSPVN